MYMNGNTESTTPTVQGLEMHDELVLVGGVLIYALMVVKGLEWGKRVMQRVQNGRDECEEGKTRVDETETRKVTRDRDKARQNDDMFAGLESKGVKFYPDFASRSWIMVLSIFPVTVGWAPVNENAEKNQDTMGHEIFVTPVTATNFLETIGGGVEKSGLGCERRNSAQLEEVGRMSVMYLKVWFAIREHHFCLDAAGIFKSAMTFMLPGNLQTKWKLDIFEVASEE
ncbi:hypothetical protein B0H13DRAFT_1859694 [Mycena leptocephala]|nr:hypothetical protein B0H13DRAFT_1859694 [Mycena leptocephala]